MKYHNHIIEKKKVIEYDLGRKRKHNEYHIFKDNDYIQTTYSLNNAKEYIDSGYNDRILCWKSILTSFYRLDNKVYYLIYKTWIWYDYVRIRGI